MNWAYGVTTVIDRLGELLPRTLGSLLRGGFPQPRLFVDGCEDPNLYHKFGLPVTTHYPTIRTYGNWSLALHELYYREPSADFYALFQDDIIVCSNLKEYLEKSNMPQDGYINLYTVPANQTLAPKNNGWFLSNQNGKGALGLVFCRAMVLELLSSRLWLERPMNKERGHRNIDGGIVHCLSTNYYGKYREYCHNPSMIQHIGVVSSMGNKLLPVSDSFPGEEFDALSLVQDAQVTKNHEVEAKKNDCGKLRETGIQSKWATNEEIAKALNLIEIPIESVVNWICTPDISFGEKSVRNNKVAWLSKKILSGENDGIKDRFKELLNIQ